MQDMEPLRGRCIGCGFLAKHAAPGFVSETYFEVEMIERERGDPFFHPVEGLDEPVPTLPVCFRLEVALGREVISARKSNTLEGRQAAAKEIFLKDRQCPSWFRYQPGLGPREHLMGKAMQDAEERRNKFEEAMEERRREFEQRMEREHREFERGLEKDRRNFNLFLTAIVVLVSLAGVIAAVLNIFLG